MQAVPTGGGHPPIPSSTVLSLSDEGCAAMNCPCTQCLKLQHLWSVTLPVSTVSTSGLSHCQSAPLVCHTASQHLWSVTLPVSTSGLSHCQSAQSAPLVCHTASQHSQHLWPVTLTVSRHVILPANLSACSFPLTLTG